MTSSSPKSLREVVAPVREIAAFALLGAVLLALLTALTNLLPTEAQRPEFIRYLYYLGFSPPGFLTLVNIVAPVVAVLLVTGVGEPTSRAKLTTMGAAVLLAVAIFFGLIFEVLLGFIGVTQEVSFLDGLKTVAMPQLVLFVLAAVALLAVFRIWQGMFYVPKPAAAPQAAWSGYGYQAPYGQPGYPQQQASQAQYGQQQQPQYGQQPAAEAQPQAQAQPQQPYAQPTQQQYGQQAGYAQQQPYGQSGYPTQQPQYGQQPTQQAQPGTYGQGTYGQAAGYGTTPGQPASGAPASPGSPAGQEEDPDRTGIVGPSSGSPAGGDPNDSGEERWRAPS